MKKAERATAYSNDVDGTRIDAKQLHDILRLTHITYVQQHSKHFIQAMSFLPSQLHGRRVTGFPGNRQLQAATIKNLGLQKTMLQNITHHALPTAATITAKLLSAFA